ncbi:MAG TPA: hypothetical protein VKA34_22740 [Balneolales bacterium]|nr:hypothetical protein [Balneolales bacterium]
MLKLFGNLKQGLEDIIYPRICISCEQNLIEANRYICPTCLEEYFQDPNPFRHSSCNDIILPEGILLQDALWQFDKGGHVQKLLHAIKYHGMAGLGNELGKLLGNRLIQNPHYRSLTNKDNLIIVPIPLHKKKLQKRGFNQARCIAEGLSEISKIPLIEKQKIQRIKNTQSQTGFSIQERLKNVKKAFKVLDPLSVSGKKVIIIDDVFTTGATSFELAAVCNLADADKTIILTIAQA